MSTTRKIAHNTIAQISGKAVSTFLGLVAIAMMTRYLGIEKFGWYITTIAFLQFIGILIDFGLIPVTAQMLSEPEFEKKKLLNNLLGFRFTTAVIFLAIAPLIALFFPYPQEVKIAISFTTLSFLAISMNQVLVGYYQTKLKMHIQAIGEVLGRIALVVGIWLLIKNHSGFIPIMIVVTISSLVYMTYLYIYAFRADKIKFEFDLKIWRAIARKMWPIAVAIIFNVVYLKGDTLLLSVMRTQHEVGIYGAAYRVIDILTQTAMMLMGVMLPILAYNWSRKLDQEFKHRYQQAFDAMMMLAVPMLVGTAVLADKIMILVAGQDFAESGKILAILSIAVFGVYLGAVFGHTSVAINKQKQVMWIFISNAVITLVGYLIFIPKFGMLGAAWMTVFSELYAGILLWAAIKHYTKQKLEMHTFAKIIFSSMVMGSALAMMINLNVFLLVVVGALIYAAFLFGLGGISKKTINEIISLKK